MDRKRVGSERPKKMNEYCMHGCREKNSEIESKRVEKKEWVGWGKTIEVCLMQEKINGSVDEKHWRVVE
jgi:hypothetical protein